MTVNRTTLLDLPLPVTGTESGVWGDVTNNGLTQYLDIAIAGRNALTSSDFSAGALTISLTEGDSSATNIAAGSAQYATLYVSSLAQNSTITAPSSNRAYRVVNADATYTLTVKAAGQTGVVFPVNTSGTVVFNGTDYVLLGSYVIASAGTASLPSITFTGDTNTGIFSPAADTIAFAEGGAEAMRIDSSGNVGIGTSSPGTKLHVSSSGDEVLRLTSSGDPFISWFSTTTRRAYIQLASDNMAIFNEIAAPMTFGTNSTERMRINSNGNVLIGSTTAPTGYARVSLVGGESSGSGANSGIQLTYNSSTYGGGAITTVNAAGGGMSFYTFTGNVGSESYTERARITSGGDLLVGTTSGSSRFKVVADGTNVNSEFYQPSTSSYTSIIFTNPNGTVGSITTNGSATTYATSSDYRLKENVAPMTGALAKVLELNPVNYTWKVDGSDGQGFIAHELQEVAPYAVSGEKDGEQMQGVDYGKITPLLTAALQEAIAEIQSLKARVAELEAK